MTMCFFVTHSLYCVLCVHEHLSFVSGSAAKKLVVGSSLGLSGYLASCPVLCAKNNTYSKPKHQLALEQVHMEGWRVISLQGSILGYYLEGDLVIMSM